MIVLILAGGEGRRMGGGKPGRRLGGISLLDRALARARLWSDDIRIADGASDLPGVGGPLGALAAALGEELLTIPCDMPFLPDDLAERLAGDRPATLAASGGHLHPVCARWRSEAKAGLADYLATGRRSLRGFAEAVGYEAVEWPVEPFDPFFNINDAADLACAEEMLKGR